LKDFLQGCEIIFTSGLDHVISEWAIEGHKRSAIWKLLNRSPLFTLTEHTS